VTMSGALKQAAAAVGKATRTPLVRKQAMELTENAALRLANLLTAKNKPYLKIGVRTRGCNGMTYTLNYADLGDKGKFDELVTHEIANTKQIVKVIIDPAALMHVIGTKVSVSRLTRSASLITALYGVQLESTTHSVYPFQSRNTHYERLTLSAFIVPDGFRFRQTPLRVHLRKPKRERRVRVRGVVQRVI